MGTGWGFLMSSDVEGKKKQKEGKHFDLLGLDLIRTFACKPEFRDSGRSATEFNAALNHSAALRKP